MPRRSKSERVQTVQTMERPLLDNLVTSGVKAARFQDASRCFTMFQVSLPEATASGGPCDTPKHSVQLCSVCSIAGCIGWYVCVAKSHSTIILFVRL